MYTQKNVILMLRKLFYLNFIFFKKIFFVQLIITYLEKCKLNNRFFMR